MRRPRISIAGLASVVALLAADCAALRYVGGPFDHGISGHGPVAYVLVVTPIVNALVLGLPFVFRRAGGTPFLVGFEVFGWAAVLAYGLSSWLPPVSISAYFVRVYPPVFNHLAEYSALGHPLAVQLYVWFVMFPATSLVLSAPLWIVALAGGLACRAVAVIGGRGRFVGAVAGR